MTTVLESTARPTLARLRTTWSAIGAAIAVALGGGTVAVVSATGNSTQSAFVAVTPMRIVDTRTGSKVGALDGSGTPQIVQITGMITTPAGSMTVVPAQATGVSLNVTVDSSQAPSSGGYVTVYGCQAERPDVSNLNFTTGDTVANAVTSTLSGTGAVCVYVYGRAHLLIDVVGYYEELTGSVGPAGPAGPAGADGAPGPAGVDGDVGPAGPPGPAGADGADGADGLSGGACQRGFECRLGDTGPGGGIVFYVAQTPFTSAAPCGTNCHYLEMAPSDWNGGPGDPKRSWTANIGVRTSAFGAGIGDGFANTTTIITAIPADTAADSAAITARNYQGGGLTDWYLPSKGELNAMCSSFSGGTGTTPCSADATTGRSGVGGFSPASTDWPYGVWYWTSTEVNTNQSYYAFAQKFDSGGAAFSPGNFNDPNKATQYLVRPVRAF